MENAAKSGAIRCASKPLVGAYAAASTRTSQPASWASATMSRSCRTPEKFDWAGKASRRRAPPGAGGAPRGRGDEEGGGGGGGAPHRLGCRRGGGVGGGGVPRARGAQKAGGRATVVGGVGPAPGVVGVSLPRLVQPPVLLPPQAAVCPIR